MSSGDMPRSPRPTLLAFTDAQPSSLRPSPATVGPRGYPPRLPVPSKHTTIKGVVELAFLGAPDHLERGTAERIPGADIILRGRQVEDKVHPRRRRSPATSVVRGGSSPGKGNASSWSVVLWLWWKEKCRVTRR